MKRLFFVRVAIRALWSVPLLVAGLVAISLAIGDDPPGQALGPMIAVSIFSLILGLLLRWSRRFLVPVAVFSALFTLVVVAGGSDYGLTHPESFFEFSAAVGSIAAMAVACVSAVIAIVKRRRKTLDSEPTPRQRKVLRAIGAVVGVAIVASGGLAIAKGPLEVREGKPAKVITVNDRFLPWEFKVVEGETVRFEVTNEDNYAHTFSIDELDADVYLGPLAQRRITMDVEDTVGASELRLYCAINGHEDMVGSVSVEKPEG
jgi:uncharacterized cupredoxin-like copper-binding protein